MSLIRATSRSVTRIGVGHVVGLLLVLSTSASLDAAGDLRLIQAVRNGDRAAVRSLLSQHVNVNATEPDGASALAWAVHRNDSGLADELIKAGANVNAPNDYGVAPLSLACTNRNAVIVEALLEAGADPNVKLWSGETPLLTCVATGSVEAVESLLAHRANPSVETRRGQTPLMWAAAQRHPEITRLLIKRGANVNAVSHGLKGFKPPTYFTFGGPEHSVEEPSGEVHEDPGLLKGGFTALMFAARSGDLESARMLVGAGANVNHVSPDYGNALLVACVNGRESVAMFLAESGADPNVVDGWGFTALHWALRDGITAIGMSRAHISSDGEWVKPSLPRLVTMLLAHGANPNARVGKGLPPFDYLPYARDDINRMPYLRQQGATPFLLAAASADVDSMRALIAAGANPLLATNEGATAVIVAAGLGKRNALNAEQEKRALEAVKFAVELGGDVNAAMKDGRTALMGAAFIGANTIIQFLATRGANINAADHYGQTALGLAQDADPPDSMAAEGNRRYFRWGSNDSGIGGLGPDARKVTADLLFSLGAKLFGNPQTDSQTK
jgi:ankyrin repeat protein